MLVTCKELVKRETEGLTCSVETLRKKSLGPRTAQGRRARDEEAEEEKLAYCGGKMGWSRTKHFKKASDNLRFSLSEVWGEWGRSEKAAEGMRGGVSRVRNRVLWGGSWVWAGGMALVTVGRGSGRDPRQTPQLTAWGDECTRRQVQSESQVKFTKEGRQGAPNWECWGMHSWSKGDRRKDGPKDPGEWGVQSRTPPPGQEQVQVEKGLREATD